jgi:hypothetical protein
VFMNGVQKLGHDYLVLFLSQSRLSAEDIYLVTDLSHASATDIYLVSDVNESSNLAPTVETLSILLKRRSQTTLKLSLRLIVFSWKQRRCTADR